MPEKKFNILAGKADTRIGDENMTETDINIRNTLKNTLAQIAIMRESEKFGHEKNKLKYKGSEQDRIIDKLWLNSTIDGNWEYTLKNLMTSVDKELLEKMTMGNKLDIRHFKLNLKRSPRHTALMKGGCTDWMYIAAMMAMESEIQKGSSLEESLWEVTQNGPQKGKYNWNKKDIDKIFNSSSSDDKTTKQPKPRPRGKKTQKKSILSLEKAQKMQIQLMVNGKHLRKLEQKSLERRKVEWGTQEVKHLETEGNITKEMNKNTKLKVTTFRKEASEELKRRMDAELKITKEEARSKILKRVSKENCQNEKLATEDDLKKDEEKRRKMKSNSVCFMKCNLCEHFAQINTIIQASSKMNHFKTVHGDQLNTSDMIKPYYPVVKIIRK